MCCVCFVCQRSWGEVALHGSEALMSGQACLPAVRTKEKGLGAGSLQSCFYPKGLQSDNTFPWEVHYLPCLLCSLSFSAWTEVAPKLQRPGCITVASFLQTYQLPKGFCLSALCQEIILLKRQGIVLVKTTPIKKFNCKGRKIICKLNESPCFYHGRVRNDLRGGWHFVSLRQLSASK